MTIKVEKRAVISLPQVFGDLGGLYECLSTLAIYIVGRYQSKSFSLQHVSQHFKQQKPGRKSFSKIQQLALSPSLALRTSVFSAIEQTFFQRLKLIYWPFCQCFASKKDRRLEKIIAKGESKLETYLDTRTIIRISRMFSTVLRLEYSPQVRKLLALQRRLTVLEHTKPGENDESSSSGLSDDQLLKKLDHAAELS